MKTNTIFIFMLSCILIVASGYFAWYVRENLNQKIELVQNYNIKAKQNKNFEFGNQLKINMETLDAQEAIIKKAFLNSKEVIGFITQLESQAQTLGLEISVDKVEYGTEESVESVYIIKPVTFAFQLTGPYSQIESFVEGLTQTKRVFPINEFKMYKTGDLNHVYNARIIIQGTTLSHE